jgi:hypothetical protein
MPILRWKLAILTLAFLMPLNVASAQGLLEKHITIHINNDRLAKVLTEIGKNGGFHFSYSGKNFPKDSLVTMVADNEQIAKILTQLLDDKYEYEERRNYIIITPALQRLSFINTDVTSENNNYSISGIVVDVKTGERLMNTSVYEKEQLLSTITDEHGYFKLKLRSNSLNQVRLTASKYAYRDTSLSFLNTVVISNRIRERTFHNNGKEVEATALGRIFMTAAQRIQSINIQGFFANRPYQVSITPGLSSHGALSSQVVNRFSLNLGGGYTAGVDGLELGGLFNINKRDTRYLQFAGVFNLVGGTVTGMQVAGVSNQSLDTVRGVQLAGFINTAESQVSGLQLSALNNRAHNLKGVQIGLVNQADSSEGVSIGLINLIRNGFYKVSISANNLMNTNLSVATGTHRFYTKVSIGANIWPDKQMYGFGLSAGHDFMFSNNFYLSAEVGYMFINTGVWADRWMQGKLLLNAQLSKRVSLFAGPSYNRYSNAQWYNGEETRYKKIISDPNTHSKSFAGWEAGLAYNSFFKASSKIGHMDTGWQIGASLSAGVNVDRSMGLISGFDVFTMRGLGRSMMATFSTGYIVLHPAAKTFSMQYNYPGGKLITMDLHTFKVLPLRAGIRTYFTKALFLSGEVGMIIPLNTNYEIWGATTDNYLVSSYNPRSFLYAVSAGIKLNKKLEASTRFEDFVMYSHVKYVSLGLAYSFKL